MKYLYEFIGTFFLMLTVGMCVIEPHAVALWAPLAIGAVLTALVYTGAHISGAHYNPAVSFAIFLRGKLEKLDLLYYWIAQFLAAILAALLTHYFKGHGAPNPLLLDPFKAFLGEFLFAFALCYVVLNVATVKETSGNSYYGWAIGFTVAAGAYAFGTISGAAFNPAVAIGAAILQLFSWSTLWIYFVATLLGGALAAAVFQAAHSEE